VTEIRWARGGDVHSLRELVRPLAGNTLTPKDAVSYYEALQQFRVIHDPDESGRVIGCGALHVMWEELGEVRTLAVHPDFTRRGLGGRTWACDASSA
jgi:amino-acid N-acetyltransferase